MKYYRFNQIAMAVLVAMLLFFGTRTLIDIAYDEHGPEKPGYEVPGTEEKPGGEGKPEVSQLVSLLAKGNAEKGQEAAQKCAICHSFEKGKPSPLGPPLHDVVGRKIASFEGFNYSPALKGKQGDWTYENLDHFIENPQAFAPGTAMAFPGLPDAQQRADVILYLRKETKNPPPLPKAEKKPEGEAPEGKPGAAPEGASEFMAALANADPKKGEADAALCKVCHTFEKGGATLIGPNLYGVVGHKIASHEGVTYTPALKAKSGEWTFENLDPWLTNPQAFAPGTSMAFPGVPDVKKRANIIAYLNANSDKPLPIPEAGAAPAEEKPAEEKPGAPAEEKPAEEKPAAPAEEKPAEEKPAEEKPSAPAEEKPAEEKPAEAAPPAAEPETPAAPAEEQAPPAEEKPAPAEEKAPPAEETPAPTEAAPPAAEPEKPAETAPPAAEEPAAPAEQPAEEKAAPAEPAAPKVEEHPEAEPSKGEEPSPSQPQPVYPDGPGEAAAKEAEPPADTDSPDAAAPPSEEQPEAGTSKGEGPSPSQPQPVYPDGPPEGL
jgi:cytochrome c